MDLKAFRTTFPELDAESFPDAAVLVRLKIAEKFFSEDLWPDETIRDHCIGLYAAHFLVAHGSRAAGGEGGAGVTGVVASKSVDGASISYDVGSTVEQGAGFWNATTYGRELYQILRVFGAGAVQL